MYARGTSTLEIQGHLRELYGIDVSPDLIGARRPPLSATHHVPALIAAAGEDASRHFLNFFIASIRNRNTRAADRVWAFTGPTCRRGV